MRAFLLVYCRDAMIDRSLTYLWNGHGARLLAARRAPRASDSRTSRSVAFTRASSSMGSNGLMM